MAICCAFGAGAESQIEMVIHGSPIEKEVKHTGRCPYLNSYPS